MFCLVLASRAGICEELVASLMGSLSTRMANRRSCRTGISMCDTYFVPHLMVLQFIMSSIQLVIFRSLAVVAAYNVLLIIISRKGCRYECLQ